MADEHRALVPLIKTLAFEDKLKSTTSWFYRGEGNDTIVIGLRGENVVVRLKKKGVEDKHSKAKTEGCDKIAASLEFGEKVCVPLLGGRYVRPGHMVAIPEGFLAKMDEQCRPFRPKSRLHKCIDTSYTHGVLMNDFCFLPGHLGEYSVSSDMNSGHNQCAVPKSTWRDQTFSIEIKPKCGFLPMSPHIRQEHQIRHSVCYYCMLQYSKVAEGKHTRCSKYCPINLFSQDHSRVLYALRGLISDPQNNLRIFLEGNLIYCQEILDTKNTELCCSEFKLETVLKESGFLGEHFQASVIRHKCGCTGPFTEKFLEIILRIMVHDSNFGVPGKECSISGEDESGIFRKDMPDFRKPLHTTMCKENGIVPSHCSISWNASISRNAEECRFGGSGVLQQLLAVQKMDVLDIEGLHPLYQKLIKHFDSNPGLRESLNFDKDFSTVIWQDIVNSYQGKPSCEQDTKVEDLKDLSQLDLNDKESLHKVLCLVCKFSLASMAKDCSLMIAFQRRPTYPDGLQSIPDVTGSGFIAYNMDLVDLDPKEVDRVKKYMTDTSNTVHGYKLYSK